MPRARPPAQKPIANRVRTLRSGRRRWAAPGAGVSEQGPIARLEVVGRLVEAFGARAQARRAPARIDRDRIDPGLREAERQLLVVVMKTADVRHDQDPRAAPCRRVRGEGRKVRAILGHELHEAAIDGGA